MKKIIIKFGLVLLIISIFGGFALHNIKNTNVTFAAESCTEGMTLYFTGKDGISGERQAFLNFVNQHLQNKSANSGLLNTAVDLYAQYKKKAMAKYQTYYPTEGNIQAEEAATQSQCYAIVQRELADARRVLTSHVETVSYFKKETVLIQKYQSINKELKKMNMALAEMKGYFAGFKDKLSAFVYHCLP